MLLRIEYFMHIGLPRPARTFYKILFGFENPQKIWLKIQWAQTKLVHMTLGYTSVLCTSLVGAHCILPTIQTGLKCSTSKLHLIPICI